LLVILEYINDARSHERKISYIVECSPTPRCWQLSPVNKRASRSWQETGLRGNAWGVNIP